MNADATLFFLAKMATIMDLNIICSTGFYYEPASAFMYWKFRSGFADVETEMYEMMRTELTKGIGNTGIKAGVIKLASSANQITPFEEKFFRAAARNNRETGATIITHTEAGTMGLNRQNCSLITVLTPKILLSAICAEIPTLITMKEFCSTGYLIPLTVSAWKATCLTLLQTKNAVI